MRERGYKLRLGTLTCRGEALCLPLYIRVHQSSRSHGIPSGWGTKVPDGSREAVMKGHRLSQSLDVYAHHRVSRGQSRLKEAVMAGPRSPENTSYFFLSPTHLRGQLQENPHPGAFRRCKRKNGTVRRQKIHR